MVVEHIVLDNMVLDMASDSMVLEHMVLGMGRSKDFCRSSS